MKHILRMLILVTLFIAGMSSCQKDTLEVAEAFDLEDYIGRYDFEIELETFRDGKSNISIHESVGYVTKENDYTIKVLFDFAAPKVNCVYEYVVKPDGSFHSTFKGAGERIGQFVDGNVEFEELIDLGDGDFKHLEFLGLNINN